MKNKTLIIIVVIAIAVLGIWYFTKKPTSINVPVKDTTSTSTNNSNSNTNTSQTSGWATYSKDGMTFKYPKDLATTYIHTQVWPPTVQILGKAYTCTPTSTPDGGVQEVKQITINQHTYCVTKVDEGAAGSTYSQYSYAMDKNYKTVVFNFTLKSVQCDNYSDPQKTQCKAERTSFDIDKIMDKIAQTLVVSQ